MIYFSHIERLRRLFGRQMTGSDSRYIYKDQKKLRWGYTTGTCAAAATLAAVSMLLEERGLSQVRLLTPKGIELTLEVEKGCTVDGRPWFGVRKDGGDDPDVTDGLLVCASAFVEAKEGCEDDVWESRGEEPWERAYVMEKEGCRLILTGGKGIGIVTKKGLSCPVGKPAINPVPRQMIWEQVQRVCSRSGFCGTIHVEICVPEADQVAERTFNSRLGIEGGISILGTSGIVEPMSETALLETIRLEIRQKIREGEKNLLVTPGNYGEAFVEQQLGIGMNRSVKCSNFIGAAMDMAVEEGAESFLLVGHGGKLIKLAAGIMNTHSSMADGRMEILAAYGAANGAGQELCARILEAVTVDEGLRLLEEAGLRQRVMGRIMERLEYHVKRRAGQRLRAEAIVFTNERGLLGETSGARELLEAFGRSSKENRKGTE